MEYISTKEASAKWGISTIRITVLAKEGRIPGAQRIGKSWLIPAGATKPAERKASRGHTASKEADSFSFPLYQFRPDWSSAKKAGLSPQQQSLFLAETAVLECRFDEAYPVVEPILREPEDIATEVGALWVAGICCIALNRADDFSGLYLRLQVLLSKDFPHRDDLAIVLDVLKTYVETIGSSATNVCRTELHEQCLPLACMQVGYANLSREAMKLGSADDTLLELNLLLLKNTGTVIAIEMMHCYLLGIYCFRGNTAAAARHTTEMVRLAYENKFYFPLVTFYRYFAAEFSPVLAQYPEEFQKHCRALISQYEKNFSDFISAINEKNVKAKLHDTDFPYIYAVLADLTNAAIAEKLGISQPTVKRKLDKLCAKLGVANKKELKEYLRNYM